MAEQDDARYRLTPKGVIWGVIAQYLKYDVSPDTAASEILLALRDAGYIIVDSARVNKSVGE